MRPVALTVILSVVFLAPTGCGRRAAPPRPKAEPTAVAQKPLPDWAPKDPSPEFLRAWEVLRPMPTEGQITTNVVKSGFTEAVQDRIRRMVWPASYEFFGSLTDEQVASFLTKKEVSIPYTSLRGSQRDALERWLAVRREAFQGSSEEAGDTRVMLYKMGAKEDFSNVRVGFGTHDTHVVGVCFWVAWEKGGPGRMFYDFAQIY